MALESATIYNPKNYEEAIGNNRAVPKTTDIDKPSLEVFKEEEFIKGFNTAIRTSIAVMRRFNGPNSEGIKILRSLYNEQLERY